MKRIFNGTVALITIAIITLACHQNRPATILKLKKLKGIIKTSAKQDTLIFKDPALSALVQQTYKYFSIFDTITPMGDSYDIVKFKLNKAEIDTLFHNSGDSVLTATMTGSDVTMALSSMIEVNLLKILEWKNIDDYDLSLLFKNSLGITKSPDKKLYCFSFDEKTGGTYRSQISIMHYNPGDDIPPKSFRIAEGSIFNSDGYDNIDTVQTKQGIKYLLSGYVIGCMTCIGNYIDLAHFEKGEFVNDFSYNITTRINYNDQDDSNNSPTIAYNAKLHQINIDYITNDMAPVCNCGENGAIKNEPGVSYEHKGNANRVTCTYAFNGSTFVLKKKKTRPME